MGYIGRRVLQRLDLKPMPDDEPAPETVPAVKEPAAEEPQWAPAER